MEPTKNKTQSLRPSVFLLITVLTAGLLAFQNCGVIQNSQSLVKDSTNSSGSMHQRFDTLTATNKNTIPLPHSYASDSTSALLFLALRVDVTGNSLNRRQEVLSTGFRYVVADKNNTNWVVCQFHPGGSNRPGVFGITVVSHSCSLSSLEVRGLVADRIARGFIKIYVTQKALGHSDITYANGYYSITDEVGSLSCTEPLGNKSSCLYSKH